MKTLMRLNWYLFIIALIYNICDYWQTMLLLETGLIHEANPFMRYLIDTYGINSCLYSKLFIFTILGILIHICHKGLHLETTETK